MEDLLRLIKGLGFNSIRIPWSNDIMKNPMPNGINYSANPNLNGKKSLEVLDYLIDRCKEIGLWVILDRHRPNKDGQSELWYTSSVSEAQWISDWKTLAERYKSKDIVIAADLHNEPHGSATWGNSSPSTDWNKAAERCGDALLSIVPNWLIIVEESNMSAVITTGGELILKQHHRFLFSLALPTKLSTLLMIMDLEFTTNPGSVIPPSQGTCQQYGTTIGQKYILLVKLQSGLASLEDINRIPPARKAFGRTLLWTTLRVTGCISPTGASIPTAETLEESSMTIGQHWIRPRLRCSSASCSD